MPRGALQRSGSNSLASLLRADPPTPNAIAAGPDATTTKRPRRRRRCLRLPLVAAGGCRRVCACDEMDPAAAPRRRAPEEKDEEDEDEGGEEEAVPPALQCFSWKKGAAAAAYHRSSAAGDGDKVMVVVEEEKEEPSLSVLPDDVMEMVLCRLPQASLLAARCVCRRWRDLTVAPQFMRMRRQEGRPHRTPWLFLFGVEGDGWGGAAAATAVHALDVAAQRWRRVGADGLKGRFLFSVAGVGDELYVVGGRSGGLGAGAVETKTHKGVVVYSPLAAAWRKAAPMRTARSRPVLGVFEMSPSRRILHARAEKHVRHGTAAGGGKFRLGGTSAVYEDPHRLSLRRLRLRDVLNEEADSLEFAPSDAKIAGEEEERRARPRLALIAVGGRGHWDEPLVSGEIYDPVTDKWFEIAGLPADVGLACSGAVCGQMFYVYCESDTLVAYHLDRGVWSIIQTSRPPPRLRDYAPALLCCSSRLLMLCVSWCDRDGVAASRREKVVRKLFELDLGSRQWGEACAHPDAPMDPNAAFAAGDDTIYAVEMFRIFGKVLDFVTACRVSDADDHRWCRLARKNAAAAADAMSSRLKSMAALHL